MDRILLPVSHSSFTILSPSGRANRILGKKKDNILDSQSQIYEKGVQIELIESILFMLLKKRKKLIQSFVSLNFYNRSVEKYYYFLLFSGKMTNLDVY